MRLASNVHLKIRRYVAQQRHGDKFRRIKNKGGKRQRDNSRVSDFVDVYRFFFGLLNLALNFERLRLASALLGILKF